MIKRLLFYVKAKDRDGERVYAKCLLTCDILISNLTEMVKEELSKFKLHIRP